MSDPIDRYTCEQVFERLEDFIDRELSPGEMKLVEEHIKICEWCTGAYQFESSFIRQVKVRVQRIAAPEGLLSKISRALDDA
jgi:anti-sigma factor (TIGR02949 family)